MEWYWIVLIVVGSITAYSFIGMLIFISLERSNTLCNDEDRGWVAALWPVTGWWAAARAGGIAICDYLDNREKRKKEKTEPVMCDECGKKLKKGAYR